MTFISNLLKKFKANDTKAKKIYTYLITSEPKESWDIVGEIGDGAFGKVYKARSRSDETVAALKQVNLEEEGDLEEYVVEIEILTDCKHDNIVNLYAAYHFENKLWMALEYCNSGALDSLMITLDKNLNEKAIKYSAKEILSGLIFLHSHNVIHRDMKAGNVLVTKDADVKLADFGVSAKLTSEKQKRNTVQGTPYWMAPEVISCQNMESFYDCRADIWSFGITLMELAQMRPPYHQMQPTRVLIKIAKADPPTLEKPQSWTPSFNSFLKRCLTKRSEDRPYGTELLNDPFIRSCDESDKRSLKVLIYEASADNIQETVEELDLKDVRQSVLPSPSIDDISENDDISLDSTEILESKDTSVNSLKSIICKEISNSIIDEQIKSEKDKTSILGVVCDIMEDNNPCTNIDDTIAGLDNQPLDRRMSIRMAMEIVPDMPEMDTKEDKDETTGTGESSETEKKIKTNLDRKKSHYKTMTKTRKFVVDGEEITTTTTKVVREGLENKNREQIQDRKMEIRELQVLAKEESRQKRQMNFRILVERENLMNRHKSEEQNFEREHEAESDNIMRVHKNRLEKMENQNFVEFTNNQKKLLTEKAKKENEFKNKEKNDFTKAIEKLPKSQRKDQLKKLKDDQNLLMQEKLKIFQEELSKDIEGRLELITKCHRQKIYELELSLLKERHQKLTKYNKEKAKLYIDHCQSMNQLDVEHKKEMFLLGKQQIKYRQEKEIEHLEKGNKKELEELDYIQQSERKTFPRFIKNTSKTRNIQKRGELDIQLSKNIISNQELKAKMKEFEESEKEREKMDLKRMEVKLTRKREAMLNEHFQRRREYDQIHAEQKKELTEQESIYFKEIERKHKEEILELSRKAEAKEDADEEEYKLQEEKLKVFYNSNEHSYGDITPYSPKEIQDKKYVEALC